MTLKIGDDLISQYVRMREKQETAAIHDRWCAIATLGAMVGRRCYFPFGSTVLYLNMYVLLLGLSGDRKSSAIKAMKRFAARTGFEKFAATRTSREAFLLDLEGKVNLDGDEIEELQFVDPNDPREVYIVADEFDEFIGINNINFVRLLGVLWDYDEEIPYRDRVKNSKSVSIKDPTVSILGGTTPTNFAKAFPPEILGQGFFSRILLIHGERNGNRNTLGLAHGEAEENKLVAMLQDCAFEARGVIKYTKEAYDALDTVYRNPSPFHFTDSRFESYLNRRFTHLLKLTSIVAIACKSLTIALEHVVYANTILAAAERQMPRALGEFGKNKNSEIVNKIMDKLYTAPAEVTNAELYESLATDVRDMHEMISLIGTLELSGKIQIIQTETGLPAYLPKVKRYKGELPFVDWKLLSLEEQEKML